VSDWGTVFLGVIAGATLATALVQIAVIIAAGRLARRLERVADRFEQELTPFFAQLNAIGRDASRAASLATAQVERVDQLFADLVERVDDTVRAIQQGIQMPLREVGAIVAALRAVLGVVRGRYRNSPRSRADDEDALFI
jgi:hypothetical protein